MAEILALVLQLDEQAVLCAVGLALEAGVATKTQVRNVLHRLTDGKAPPASPINAPQALRFDLIILDELSYLPFSPSGVALLCDRLTLHVQGKRSHFVANPDSAIRPPGAIRRNK